MRINVQALKEEGYHVSISDDAKVIDIYPCERSLEVRKYVFEEMQLTEMQVEDILTQVEEYQIFNAIKKTGAYY